MTKTLEDIAREDAIITYRERLFSGTLTPERQDLEVDRLNLLMAEKYAREAAAQDTPEFRGAQAVREREVAENMKYPAECQRVLTAIDQMRSRAATFDGTTPADRREAEEARAVLARVHRAMTDRGLTLARLRVERDRTATDPGAAPEERAAAREEIATITRLLAT